MADVVEHRADDADTNEVHDSLRELANLHGVSLEESLELLFYMRPPARS
jgi:hypothetical protein